MKVLLAIIAAAALAAPTLAAIMPDRIYEFDGSLADANGGPALSPGSGGSFIGNGPSGGLRFAANQGPSGTNMFANPAVYSVEMFFSLDEVSNFRRLIKFKPGAVDDGLYLRDGDLTFFGGSRFHDTNAKPGQMLHLVLSRDASGRVTAFVDGQQRFFFLDNAFRVAEFEGGTAAFFKDDKAEASSGFVDFIRGYDRALTSAEVAELYNGGVPLRFTGSAAPVPEPAAWAMMIGGFALAGTTLRRRRDAPRAVAA